MGDDMKQHIDICGFQVLPQEMVHIEKHKYFMSLEAQQDVGMEAAVSDWFDRIRQDFALWFNRQDITEQMISLNLHLARLKSKSIQFDETEEIDRFAEHWRMHHPRIPSGEVCEEEVFACESICRITFVANESFSGTCIEKRVCLHAGLHIRPSVHLYTLMHDRYDVRMLLSNENVASVAAFCPQFIYELDGRPFFDVTPVNILEFLEVAAVPNGSLLTILVESSNDSLVREICMELCFLDRKSFCSSFDN